MVGEFAETSSDDEVVAKLSCRVALIIKASINSLPE